MALLLRTSFSDFSELCSNRLPSWQRSKALKARQFTVLPLYKTSTEIRGDFSGQESWVKKDTVTLGKVPVPGDTVGFEKLLIYLVCFASHRGLYIMLQFFLLRLRLHHSAAPVCLTVSLGARFGFCIRTTEQGPRKDPFQGETGSSPASLQQCFLGKQ